MKLKAFILGHRALSVVCAVLITVAIGAGTFTGIALNTLKKINYVPKAESYTHSRSKDKTDEIKTKKTNPDDPGIWHSDDVINILLAGIDNVSKRFPYGKSDSMMILSVNKASKKISIVSLSRATYAQIEGYDATRLSHAHGYGDYPLMLQTVESNYRIDIDNFVSAGFDDFKKIIDALGGCEIELTEKEANALNGAFERNDMKNKGEGAYLLNGDLTLEYARLRKIDTDWMRTSRQRAIIISLIDMAKSKSIPELYSLLNMVLPCVKTDFTVNEIISLMYTAVSQYKNWDISQYIVPHISTPLTLVDDFEVLKIDWDSEVTYLHDLLYEDVPDEKIVFLS